MNASHTVSTTAPVNGFNIADANARPHLVEGYSANDLATCFKDQKARQAYLYIPGEDSEPDRIETLSHPTGDYGS